jgi:hypothetical protein
MLATTITRRPNAAVATTATVDGIGDGGDAAIADRRRSRCGGNAAT